MMAGSRPLAFTARNHPQGRHGEVWVALHDLEKWVRGAAGPMYGHERNNRPPPIASASLGKRSFDEDE